MVWIPENTKQKLLANENVWQRREEFMKSGGGEGEQKECEWKKDLSSSVMDIEGRGEKYVWPTNRETHTNTVCQHIANRV